MRRQRTTLPKRYRKLAVEAERNGATFKPTKNGWLVFGPDGRSITTIHMSESDVRSEHNVRSRLRRAGVLSA